jgi:hypothetical protein
MLVVLARKQKKEGVAREILGMSPYFRSTRK